MSVLALPPSVNCPVLSCPPDPSPDPPSEGESCRYCAGSSDLTHQSPSSLLFPPPSPTCRGKMHGRYVNVFIFPGTARVLPPDRCGFPLLCFGNLGTTTTTTLLNEEKRKEIWTHTHSHSHTNHTRNHTHRRALWDGSVDFAIIGSSSSGTREQGVFSAGASESILRRGPLPREP